MFFIVFPITGHVKTVDRPGSNLHVYQYQSPFHNDASGELISVTASIPLLVDLNKITAGTIYTVISVTEHIPVAEREKIGLASFCLP